MTPRTTSDCQVCGKEFEKLRALQSVCSLTCAKKRSRQINMEARLKVKQERAEIVKRKQAIKTIPELKAAAQIAFNAFIRARDWDKPCICCDRFSFTKHLTGSQWDAGHYRSRGSADHLRFNELNVHRQLVQCNRGHSKVGHMRNGVIKRIGLEATEAIDNDNGTHKWTTDELRLIEATYKAKTKALLAERADQQGAA